MTGVRSRRGQSRCPPADLPPGPITLTIDSDRPIVTAPFLFEAKAVRPLKVLYYQLIHLGLTPEFHQTVVDSGDFIRGVYPLSDQGLTNQPAPFNGFFPPIEPFSRMPRVGLGYDANTLWLLSKTTGADRVVGIVPPFYFQFHFFKTLRGVASKLHGSVAFVTDGDPTTTAHELGHTFGLIDTYGPAQNGVAIEEAYNPIWAQHQSRTFSLNCAVDPNCTIDFMGTERQVPYPTQPFPVWTTPVWFGYLFHQFRTSPVDPPVLLVTGSIEQNGTAAFDRIHRTMEGVVTPSDGNDASIRLLDAQHQILTEVFFALDFVMGNPPLEVEGIPFGFSLPDLPSATSVEIVRDGVTLVRQDIASALLKSAVQGLPDNAFASNPSQLRNALLNKVEAFERQMITAATQGARMRLQNDIRNSLENWLVTYEPQTPLQLSKQAILTLVDTLAARLK